MIEEGDEHSNDDGDDDELEEGRAEERKAAAGKRSASNNKETERRKRELITMGKAKGFLTYDEVNDHMPESIVSSDQIDDWLSTLGGEGIEIVDSASQVKVADKGGGQDAQGDDEEESEGETTRAPGEAAGQGEEEEEEDGYSKTNDPVRMYLRKMGSVSLLTREGEVEIAKRIEDGERRVLQVVLNSPVAIEELLELGDRDVGPEH